MTVALPDRRSPRHAPSRETPRVVAATLRRPMERAMPHAPPSQEPDRLQQGYFPSAPPRPTVGDAVRRYWLLLLVAALGLGAAGAFYADSRRPVYEATASVSVGLVDLTTQSVPGFAVGGAVVAGGYSRSVQTDDVIVPAARRLHMTPREVRERVTSSSVPDSPTFTITASGSSARGAVRVANAVTRSMIAYGGSGSNAASADLLRRYREAVRARNQARRRLEALRLTYGLATEGSASAALAKAVADVAAQELRVNGLADQYRSRASEPRSDPVLQPLAYAVDASNDRSSKIQLYGAVGVLAGLCLSIALAVLMTAVRHRRLPAF
jgi:uncharacterized protein involved in exopolysaccharide biosynthesis